jgi:hypothetical protein
MKTSHILILTGLVAGIIAFGWQTYAIQQLQAEVAALRKDLRSVLETALDKPTASSSDQDRQRREKLELIKLRNEVRSNHAASSGAPVMGSWTRGSKTSTQVEFRTLGRT